MIAHLGALGAATSKMVLLSSPPPGSEELDYAGVGSAVSAMYLLSHTHPLSLSFYTFLRHVLFQLLLLTRNKSDKRTCTKESIESPLFARFYNLIDSFIYLFTPFARSYLLRSLVWVWIVAGNFRIHTLPYTAQKLMWGVAGRGWLLNYFPDTVTDPFPWARGPPARTACGQAKIRQGSGR